MTVLISIEMSGFKTSRFNEEQGWEPEKGQ